MIKEVIKFNNFFKIKSSHFLTYLHPLISVFIFAFAIKTVDPSIVGLRLPIFQGITCILSLINLSILYSKGNKFQFIEYFSYSLILFIFCIIYYQKFNQLIYIISVYVLLCTFNLILIYIIKIYKSLKIYGVFNIFLSIIIPIHFYFSDFLLIFISLLFFLTLLIFIYLRRNKLTIQINFKPSLYSFITQSPLLLYPLFDKYISIVMPINEYTSYVIYSKVIFGVVNWLFIFYNVKLINDFISINTKIILLIILTTTIFLLISYYLNNIYFYLSIGLISVSLLSNITSLCIRNSYGSFFQIISSTFALILYSTYMVYLYNSKNIWEFIFVMYILFLIPLFPLFLITLKSLCFKYK